MATPDTDTMRNLQKQGKAMPPSKPGGRPRFNIENAADISNAIRAVGRVRPNTPVARNKVRKYIIGRANALGKSGMIPDTWQADGSLKSGATS
jgi:hypothetical protein